MVAEPKSPPKRFERNWRGTLESRNEMGSTGGRAMFDGPHHWRDRRPLDPSDPARVLPAHPPLRRISVRAWDHTAFARGATEETGPARCPAPHSLSGVPQAA